MVGAPPLARFFGNFRSSSTKLVEPLSVALIFSLMGPRGVNRPKLNYF